MKVVVHLSLDTTAGMIYTQQCPHNHTLHTSSTQQQAWSSHHYTQQCPHNLLDHTLHTSYIQQQVWSGHYDTQHKGALHSSDEMSSQSSRLWWWNYHFGTYWDDCTNCKGFSPLFSHAIGAIDLAVPVRSTKAVSPYLWRLVCVKVWQMTAVTQLTLLIELKHQKLSFFVAPTVALYVFMCQ